MPTAGVDGAAGCALMAILADVGEVHPEILETLSVYVPASIPDIFVVVPDPDVIIPAGVLIIVQIPVAGKPLNSTLPVASLHVVWVIVPIVGATGVAFTVRVAACVCI